MTTDAPRPLHSDRPRTRLFGRLLDAAQRRLRRARGGSVLILVVALLVLLALIGTAFITATGTDRVASVQHGYNVQIDLLVEGVKEMTASRLTSKLAPRDPPGDPAATPVVLPGPTSYRPAMPTTRAAVQEARRWDRYYPWVEYSDIDYAPWEAMLADRYPVTPFSGAVVAGNRPWWANISASPLAADRSLDFVNAANHKPTLFTNQFASPYVKVGPTKEESSPARYSGRSRTIPWYVDVPTTGGQIRRYPALLLSDPDDPMAGQVPLAADADADGIADAGLFELPVGQVNGVRYYAAVRVIDNSAAVNASVAWQLMTTGDPEYGRMPTDISPVNIDLRRLVLGPLGNNGPETPAKFDEFNNYRMGYAIGTGGSLTMQPRTGVPAEPFEYATRFDQIWGQLGSRLDNPGKHSDGTNVNNDRRLRAFGLGETAMNAARFTLADKLGPQSALDRLFPNGMRMATVARDAFEPNQAFANATSMFTGPGWYETIFDYENLYATPAQIPLRPLLVGHNAVSNAAPGFIGDPRLPLDEDLRQFKYQYRGDWPEALVGSAVAPGIYHVGDWVRYIDYLTGQPRAYVCVRNHPWAPIGDATSQPPLLVKPNPLPPFIPTTPGVRNVAFWAEVPWYSAPVKTNLNTASFGELYAAFTAVMGDAPLARPATGYTDEVGRGGGTPNHADYFTFGNVLRPVAGTTPPPDPINPVRLNPYFVRQLRAALAAVNTIDLRDQDEDVTSRTVDLMYPNGVVGYRAQVFGSERQPYISEAIVHIPKTLTPRYVGVELFNPHPYPISLNAFGLYRRARDVGDANGTSMIQVVSLAGKTIPANGYVYVENERDNRPQDLKDEITADPPLGTERLDKDEVSMEAPELERLLEGGPSRELFLLRTRRNDGRQTDNSAIGANRFNEVTGGPDMQVFNEPGGPVVATVLPNGPDHWVPVDQLEYAGILESTGPTSTVDPTPIPVDVRYHYRRATTPGSQWHTVYAGPYNPKPPGVERRQKGWIKQLPPTPTPTGPPPGPSFNLPAYCRRTTTSDKQAVTTDVTTYDFFGPFADGVSTFRTRSLQVNASGSAGPYKPRMPGPNGDGALLAAMPIPRSPAGGFLRAGDVMQVTFCGSYRLFSIAPPANGAIPPTLPEVNTITMDAAFADDGDSADNWQAGSTLPLEQLGRFCPIEDGTTYRDLARPPAAVVNRRVAWANDLFDYFTVLSPQDDYLPNVDADGYAVGMTVHSRDPTVRGSAPKWPVQTTAPPVGAAWADNTGLPPPGVANGVTVTNPVFANRGREDGAAIHGLINVNTANWMVLSTLPFTNNRDQNLLIAREIVKYRDADPRPSMTPPEIGRPFRNLFDLMNVPGLSRGTDSSAAPWFDPNTADPDNARGDVTPLQGDVPGSDGSAGDFEARFLIINRISNMVTFRSDSFTVYVIVQGWRNAGTTAPELVTQRRAAYILDRSAVLPVIPPTPAFPPADVPWPGINVTAPSITPVPQP